MEPGSFADKSRSLCNSVDEFYNEIESFVEFCRMAADQYAALGKLEGLFSDADDRSADFLNLQSGVREIKTGLYKVKCLLRDRLYLEENVPSADMEKLLCAADAEIEKITAVIRTAEPESWTGDNAPYEHLMQSFHRLSREYTAYRKSSRPQPDKSSLSPSRDSSGAPTDAELVYQMDVYTEGRRKSIRFLHGDITRTNGNYDVLVCSAFKNGYASTPGTLIGGLLARGISVTQLSYEREMDLSRMGAWMSGKIEGPFSRVAVVELLEYSKEITQEQIDNANLKAAFSTMRFLLEQAALRGVPVGRIAMPVLGTGRQKIGLNYIAAPLVKQCTLALTSIPEMETIDIWDLDAEKISALAMYAKEIVTRSPSFIPKVFISYSRIQTEWAKRLRVFLDGGGVSCWMAPDSVPPGSDYLKEIPVALSNVKVVLLVLSEDAMRSKWVEKEVATAIGTGVPILPAKIAKFDLDDRFRFLLEGEQIMNLWDKEEGVRFPMILDALRPKI